MNAKAESRDPSPEAGTQMTEAHLEAAAAFLEEYALRPPRAEPHHPAADSPKWRAIQAQLRDLARRLRLAGGEGSGAAFSDRDTQFLETQSSRLFRMHHWIQRGPLTPEARVMGEVARMAAERMLVVAAIAKDRIRA
jgi:hypothetical protein